MAYDLTLPIVALPIVAFLVLAVPVVALRLSSSTFDHYKHCGIWSMTVGTAEADFEGQEVGDNARHSVRFLSELESGCKVSSFFGIQ
jgi:hypothetical protein